MIDGAPMGITGGFNYVPLVDAVEEFKVAAPTSDASHGLSGGGVINMTMKSGSNQLHGGVSWFLRNNVLDANNTQSNRAGLKSQQHQFNQFSAMVSGPIIRNRFFYTGDYDGYRERTPFPTTVTVPTLPQREGDFSQTLNSSRQLVAIYDPLSTRQVGNTFVRDAFGSNRIPPNRMSKIGQNVVKFFPLPNVTTDPVTNFNNYASSPNIGRFGYDSWHAKFDYLWDSSHRTSASVTENWGFATRLNNGISGPATMGPDPQTRNHYGAILDHVWTINPTTVLNVRLNWTRFAEMRRLLSTGLDMTQLGFSSTLAAASPLPVLPVIEISRFATLGESNHNITPFDSFQIFPNVVKAWNKHNLKFGADLRLMRESDYKPRYSAGRYTFNTNWTRGPLDTSSSAPLGHRGSSAQSGFPHA